MDPQGLDSPGQHLIAAWSYNLNLFVFFPLCVGLGVWLAYRVSQTFYSLQSEHQATQVFSLSACLDTLDHTLMGSPTRKTSVICRKGEQTGEFGFFCDIKLPFKVIAFNWTGLTNHQTKPNRP
jgi:hypothetical protein